MIHFISITCNGITGMLGAETTDRLQQPSCSFYYKFWVTQSLKSHFFLCNYNIVKFPCNNKHFYQFCNDSKLSLIFRSSIIILNFITLLTYRCLVLLSPIIIQICKVNYLQTSNKHCVLLSMYPK